MIPLCVPGHRSSIPIATYAVLALNVVFWMVLQTLGSEPGFTASICNYALWPGALWAHDAFDIPPDCLLLHATPDSRPVALFTSMFLHGGWVHLIVNMWYLLVLAPHLEDRSGSPIVFLLFYLACGLGAAAGQIAIEPTSMTPTLGASGAIAGLLGAYLVLFPRRRIVLLFALHFIPVPVRTPAAIVAVVWFALQVLGAVLELLGRNGEIAYGAHVGGFLTGVALSLLYHLYQRPPFGRLRQGADPRSSTHHVGIDLGTSNGCVAVMDGGSPRIIENSDGGRTTPAVVSFVDDSTVVVGERAKRQAIDRPEHTLYGVKRFLGRRFPHDMNGWRVPYKLVQEPDTGGIAIKTPQNLLTPQQILARVLTALKTTANTYFGQNVMCAKSVIAVPPCHNHLQRLATLEAAREAGLEVTGMISDSAAAALTYCNDKRIRKGTIAVVDLGGGTCDVAIVEIDSKAGKQVLRVLAHTGDALLGGEDFDQLVVDYLADQFEDRYGIDLRDSSPALQRLKESSEKAKIDLSFKKSTWIELPYITLSMTSDHKHLDSGLTRSSFESMASGLIDRLLDLCHRATLAAGCTPNDINAVILIGGQTRMPLIEHRVRQHFGREVHRPADFSESVAVGAALHAASLSDPLDDTVRVIEATSHSVIMEDSAGNMTRLIEKSAPIPAVLTLNIATVAPDQTSISFRILQKDYPGREEDACIGWYEIEDIPPSSHAGREYQVRFVLDANCLLEVSARDLSTGEGHPVSHRVPTASTGPMSTCNANAEFVVTSHSEETLRGCPTQS